MSTAEPQNSSHHDPSSRTKVTVPSIRHAKGQRSLVMVTAYDAAFARILDDAGVDILLVGDSLGMVVQGEATTLGVTVEQMIYHARAVARGTRFAHIVVDMPFLSYQVNVDEAVRNAGRMLSEGQAHAVKLEGGQPMVPTIERMVGVGIPVMGHLGLTPQSVHAMGGFKVQGREARDAERIVADARALEAAGVYALVLEGVPTTVAAAVREAVTVPTIGIGAGVACDGQVLVCYDLLGMLPGPSPRFVKRYDEFYERGVRATQQFVDEVRSGAFPSEAHSYGSGTKSS